MRTPHGLTSALVLAAVTAFARGGSAQSPTSPQDLYRQGVAAYQVRDYATALASFQRAYVLSGRPELLMNVAMTFQAAERRREAIETFRQFLSMAPDAPNRAEVSDRIATLERELAATRAPVESPPELPPLPRPIAVVAPPRAVAAPPVWPWITLGSGALLTAVGATLLAIPTDPGGDRYLAIEQDYLDARDRRATLQITGGALGAVGLTAVFVGVGGLVSRPRAHATHTAWNLRCAPLPGGGTLGVSHAF